MKRKLFLSIVMLSLVTFITNAHNIGTIKGTVKDAESGQIIPYANIIVHETVLGTSTNINGNFEFRNIHAGHYELLITHIGYETAKQEVTVKEDETTTIEIKLKPSTLDVIEVSIEAERPYSAASSKEIRNIDLEIRPNRSAQDMLQLVPGLVIAQHAGGGKAEQIFIRGFDCDHGTDVAVSVDGMPVNMVSHGHGQGYADLHFLIPELVEELGVNKGPYFAEYGNFSTGGAVSFKTKEQLDNNLLKIEGGQFNTSKVTMLYQMPEGGAEQNAYFGTQYYATDGPFESPQGFQRLNVFGKYFSQLGHNSKLTVSIGSFSSAWDASGQIPERAVRNDIINRFGGLDDLEGGTTGRQNFNFNYLLKGKNDNDFSVQGYFCNYNFKLFSNFTLFLEDSVNGDMIEQLDDRQIHGLNAQYNYTSKLGNKLVLTKLGGGYRADNINVGLWHSPDRIRMESLVDADVRERNLFFWGKKDFILSSKFRVQVGIRDDYFTYNVNDHTGAATDSINNGLPHASGYAQQNIVSPKLNIVYKPVHNLDIYINSGTGFHSNDARNVVIGQKISELEKIYKSKGLNDNDIDNKLTSYNFDPTQKGVQSLPRASGGELGLRTKLAKRLHIGIAAWYLYMEKELVYVGDGGMTELSDPTQRTGIDIEGRLKIKSWLWADADVCIAKGTIIGLPDGENHIPLAPQLTSTGGVTIMHSKGFEACFRYRHIGDRPANEDNSVVAEGSIILSLGLAYKLNNFKFSMLAENLLDTEWNEAQFDTESKLQGEATSVSELHYTPGNPRNIQFGISYLF